VVDIHRADPIFIHGISPRSGTNFLWDLLLLHPDCAPAIEPVREDLFLQHSDHLLAFSEAVRQAWNPRWGEFGPALPERLLAGLGEGLLSFLWVDRDRRLVTKSPSVLGLERFSAFFPDARLLLLVRDGRSVTHSSMETFGWEFERAVRTWADAADTIDRFRETNAHRADRWRLVRYEDLVEGLDEELPAILRFTGLDPDRYDLEAARNLPVRGSSSFFGPGRSSVHWEPVEKGVGFAPTGRWRSWTPDQLGRFEWLAGDQLRSLGYETHGSPRRASLSSAKHRVLDVGWAAREMARAARMRLGHASRPLRRRLGLVR
jgi:Sulfotransferase family